jgi:predicted Zn-dependent protease
MVGPAGRDLVSRWRVRLLTTAAVVTGLSPLLLVTADEYAIQRIEYRLAQSSATLFERVDALMQAGKFDRAIALLREEVARNPDAPGFHQALDAVLLRSGHRLKSRDQLEALRDLLAPRKAGESSAGLADHSTARSSGSDR